MCSLRNAPGFGLPFRWRYKWSSSFLNFRWKLCGILCALLSNSSTFLVCYLPLSGWWGGHKPFGRMGCVSCVILRGRVLFIV